MSREVKRLARELLGHLQEFFEAEAIAEAGPSDRPLREVIVEGSLARVERELKLSSAAVSLFAFCPEQVRNMYQFRPACPLVIADEISAARCIAVVAGALEKLLVEDELTESEAAE